MISKFKPLDTGTVDGKLVRPVEIAPGRLAYSVDGDPSLGLVPVRGYLEAWTHYECTVLGRELKEAPLQGLHEAAANLGDCFWRELKEAPIERLYELCFSEESITDTFSQA
jgi:hypothetical protein